MDSDHESLIAEIAGARPIATRSLGGGCIGEVRRIDLADGRRLVAKLGGPGSGLKTEGFMLRYLAEHSDLPVPAVLHADDDLLLIDYLAADGRLDDDAQVHAADLVAALHGVTGPAFGFDRNTVLGGLDQPNPPSAGWRDFFRDQRLLFMANEAMTIGRLPSQIMHRLERFCGTLDRWIGATATPSLIHGDMWGGNVLAHGGRISGFIDPAIYHADAEIELAFTTLFNTFGDAFFSRYAEHRPIAPGFFEERRDIYNLYPLLVHVRLFGGSYVGSVDNTLRRFGF